MRACIFTPGYEMKFAGHPTLGTAQVVRDLLKTGDALTLEFKAGVVPVTAQGDAWTFTAPCPNGVGTAAPALGRAEIASLVGLNEDDLLGDPIWIDTGADQLLVPLRSVDAVRARCRTARNWTAGRKAAWDARPRICSLSTKARSKPAGRWSRRAISSPRPAAAWTRRGHRLGLRQPGGWLQAQGRALPASLVVRQGAQIGRPSRLLWMCRPTAASRWAAARSISGAASSRSDIGRAKSARAVARAPSAHEIRPTSCSWRDPP